MKRLYLLRTSFDPKIVGVKDGERQATITRDGFRNVKEYDRLIEMLGTPKYHEVKASIEQMNFELQCVRLLSKAKLTDFLNYGPYLSCAHFLVSEKISGILRDHHIPTLRLFPATVISRPATKPVPTTEHKYYLPYLPWQTAEIIDFARSIFYTGLPMRKKQYYKFATATELSEFTAIKPTLNVEEIYLNDKFDASLDMFDLPEVGLVISEKLKVALEAVHPTAMVAAPAFGENIHYGKVYV